MRIPAFPVTRPAAFSAPLSKSIAKVVSSINQKYAQNDGGAAAKIGSIKSTLSEIKTAEEAEKSTNAPVRYRPDSGDVCFRRGFAGAFDDVNSRVDCLQRLNEEYFGLIKKHIDIAADETQSAEDRELSGKVAEKIQKDYLCQIDTYYRIMTEQAAGSIVADALRAQDSSVQKEQTTTADENIDGIMKDFYSSATGLSGLDGKTVDEVYDAVNKVLEKMRGCADQFKLEYEKKYEAKLERREPYKPRSQEITDYYENLVIDNLTDGWENIKILWEQSMRFQLDPDQVKHIFTRA